MARAACSSLPFRHYIGGNRRKRLKLRCFREFRCEKTRIVAIFGVSLASWGDVAGFRTNLTGGPCPSPRRAYAWLVGWHGRHTTQRKLSDHQRFVQTLHRIEPSIAVGGRLARNFLGLIHRRDLAGFDQWLERARNCVVPELRRFATGLRADLDAVRAAFSSPWSSGQVEGHVNRLKFLKRQMYGRAGLDLLRVRVLHPN